MKERDWYEIMQTLRAEGWQWDVFRLTPEGEERGWWYKPGDARYTRAGDPTGLIAALFKAWRLREYHSEGGAR